MNKTIVVLANSMKRGGRCLAGKEIVRRGSEWEVGSWIRPVATTQSGAVPAYPMQLGLGHMPRLLEIVELPLAGPAPTPDQPENWLLEMPIKPMTWQSHGSFPRSDINRLVDNPPGIWNEKTEARRVRAGYPQAMPQPASLYLLKPERIESIKIWSEPNPFEPSNPVKRHRQAIVRYAGISHELDIDDIDFANKYYPKFPNLSDPSIYITLRDPDRTFICVSLTPEFHGHHYKIAAAFFEPPE